MTETNSRTREAQLEAALLDYVRRYGVTDQARRALTAPGVSEPQRIGLTLRRAENAAA